MTGESTTKTGGLREVSQLLRIQERLTGALHEVLKELQAPVTVSRLRELRNATGSAAPENFAKVTTAVEAAIRELKICESELQKGFLAHPEQLSLEGVSNLPAPLSRFLAERSQNPHFSCEVLQDPVRGWVIRWKEYTAQGIVRGFGQFYERPYAWLDD
jgi:hypothetical protein